MCLSEIGGLELDVAAPAYAPQLRQLFARTVGALSTVIPPTLGQCPAPLPTKLGVVLGSAIRMRRFIYRLNSCLPRRTANAFEAAL